MGSIPKSEKGGDYNKKARKNKQEPYRLYRPDIPDEAAGNSSCTK
jgi:hypothetical protein